MLETIHLLTLLNLKGFGRNTVNSILKTVSFKPSGLKEISDMLQESKMYRVKAPSLNELENAYSIAIRDMERCEKLGIRILTQIENEFPIRLKHIPNPPVVIYAKGNVQSLNEELSVAIIGTREPSNYGEKCGELFGKVCTEKGLVVVSGLAKGIDATGHRGCLKANGQTIAVLAQGLDTTIYPKENKPLAEEILEHEGCLISEYSLWERGRPNYFVERDRIQAGLSGGVIVIETDVKGGTMHTVGFCLEQNKPLGCLNHPAKYAVDNAKARGNKHLIDQGKAQPLFTTEDIELFISKMEKVSAIRERITDLPAKIILNTQKNDSEQLKLF